MPWGQSSTKRSGRTSQLDMRAIETGPASSPRPGPVPLQLELRLGRRRWRASFRRTNFDVAHPLERNSLGARTDFPDPAVDDFCASQGGLEVASRALAVAVYVELEPKDDFVAVIQTAHLNNRRVLGTFGVQRLGQVLLKMSDRGGRRTVHVTRIESSRCLAYAPSDDAAV